MHAGVSFTLIRTKLTREHARVQLGVNELIGCFGLSANQPRCGGTNVRAIKVGSDTPPQTSDISAFAQTSVRAGGADLLAQREGVQDFSVVLGVLKISLRVSTQHGFDHSNIHSRNGFGRTRFSDGLLYLWIDAMPWEDFGSGTAATFSRRCPAGACESVPLRLQRNNPNDSEAMIR